MTQEPKQQKKKRGRPSTKKDSSSAVEERLKQEAQELVASKPKVRLLPRGDYHNLSASFVTPMRRASTKGIARELPLRCPPPINTATTKTPDTQV